MSLSSYQIANMNMNINITNFTDEFFERLANFRLDKQEKADLNFIIHKNKHIQLPQGKLIAEHETSYIKWLQNNPPTEGYSLYMQDFDSEDIFALVNIPTNWDNCSITCYDYSDEDENTVQMIEDLLYYGLHVMIGIVFRYRLLEYRGIVVHASGIKWRDKGILFSAPSGTGKSTQAGLWHEHMEDTVILNDDTPALRFVGDKPYIFGSPWSGSTDINCNDAVPLSAVILLEQAPENQIISLNTEQALPLFLPRFFLPYFDQHMLEQALTICSDILSSVPIYLLRCRPDFEAVELVKQCLT